MEPNNDTLGIIVKPVVITEQGDMRDMPSDTDYPVYQLKDGEVIPTSFEVDGQRWELSIMMKRIPEPEQA